jgi:glycosyltransferase involved in cell wall biosynthesis
MPLTAVIITLNEEHNIGRCLDSLAGIADEVLVVDSGSTDSTEAICKEKGARFVHHLWEGYSTQKNFANSMATYDLILSLDADEALSEQLAASIRIVKDNPVYDVWEMNRRTNYCGKWISHCGWYPDRKPRLFDRRKARWNGSKLHEKLLIDQDARIGRLTGDIHHYSYRSISHHIEQINHYTDISSREAFEKGKKAGCFKIFIRFVWKFKRDYIFKLGFLDGYYGFVVCALGAYSKLLKYIKLRELWKEKAGR